MHKNLFLINALMLIALAALPAVTANEARDIAMKDAGVKIAKVKTSKEKNYFEVKFSSESKDYEYKLDADTGAILKREWELRNMPPSSGRGIDQAKAESVAKDAAGVLAKDISKISAKPDSKDGRPVFEVEIKTLSGEYEIIVDKASGVVIEFEEEIKAQPQAVMKDGKAAQPAPR